MKKLVIAAGVLLCIGTTTTSCKKIMYVNVLKPIQAEVVLQPATTQLTHIGKIENAPKIVATKTQNQAVIFLVIIASTVKYNN